MTDNPTKETLLTFPCDFTFKIFGLANQEFENEAFCIEIKDNALGIAKHELVKIFRYGYTTKEKGHGFGLHTSAITAREMGGSLTAHSEGLGTDACFKLKLPYRYIK